MFYLIPAGLCVLLLGLLGCRARRPAPSSYFLLLLRETHGLTGHLRWAVHVTSLGLAILGSALFFEKRGEEARRWAQAAQEKLREWN